MFPKLVFAIRDGLNHKFGDPNYDIKQLALECASKRMYPDILNYDQVVKVTGSFKTPMGCRSFLGVYEDENGEQIHDGRNNLGVISSTCRASRWRQKVMKLNSGNCWMSACSWRVRR